MFTIYRFSLLIPMLSVAFEFAHPANAQTRLDDCNSNGFADRTDIANGTGGTNDCNYNRIPDNCELNLPSSNLSFEVTQTLATGFETESVVATYTTYAGAVSPLDQRGHSTFPSPFAVDRGG